MRKTPKNILLLAFAIFVTTIGPWVPLLQASSHREAPLTAMDPTIDTTDVYAFRSPDDPSKVTLMANWIPFEEPAGGPNFYHFDDTARYLIKIDRDGDGREDLTYEWRFQEQILNTSTFLYNTNRITSVDDPDYNYRQRYTVTQIAGFGSAATRTVLGSNLLMPPDNIGPRSTPNYETLAAQAVYNLSGGARVFVGQRDDPFFVDVASIFDLLGLRPFNSAHLLPLANSAGVDTPGGFNIHTTSIQVPITTVAPTCPVNASGIPTNASDQRCVVGVWATAERREFTDLAAGTQTASGNFVQVSRLGNPLINEVITDLARKDAFNALAPTGDSVLLDRVTDPEAARLIDTLYPSISVPPPPRNDLVTVFLTGIPGLNQQMNSVATPSEQLRLNLAIAPTAGVCSGNPLGVIAGDNAGFPNGRRLEDDVVDIELRALAGGYALTPSFNISPNNRLGDGVNSNDRPCLASFPYMPTPHQGYSHTHHAVGAATTPAATGDVLSINKTTSPMTVGMGGNITFNITVTNTSGAQATGVTVTDTLPSNVTFVSSSASQGSCTGTSTVTCNVGTLAAGANATVTIVARTTSAGTVTNTANVTSAQADTVTTNNASTSSSTVSTTAAPTVAFAPSPINGAPGQNTNVTVTINAPQSTPTTITLVSNNPGVATVPQTVTIQAGQTSVTFALSGVSVGNTTITATLPASLGGQSTTANVNIQALAAAAAVPTLSEWALIAMLMAFATLGLLKLRL